MKKLVILLLVLYGIALPRLDAQKVAPAIVVVKLKAGKSLPGASYFAKKYHIKVRSMERIYPQARLPETSTDRFGHKPVDLSLFYRLELETPGNELKVASLISRDEAVEYAEPYYLPEPLYVPDDPKIPSQYALNAIRAFDAWDVFRGDTTVTVGITDMGIDLAHEDLQNKIAYNYNDPVDGMDNDNDGYTDNFYGWDLGDNDNNPQWNEEGTEGELQHGVWVSGAGFAETDNGTGIASPGFNVKFLPVKISDRNGALVRSYEGIIYAAQHGCKVINCSWGSTFYSQYARDITDYVTYIYGALVVAAAGNYGNSVPFYPASYPNVLSVAGTGPTDEKWPNSSYGIYVDVCAPADNVLTTWANNSYSGTWGTSFASPQTAALAALVLEYYGDTLNPWQIRAIIKNTARNIDTVGSNTAYAGMLGKGIIDMYAALTASMKPGIFAEDISVKTSHYSTDSAIYAGDTVYFSVSITNYLAPASGLCIVMSSGNEYITMVDTVYDAGSVGQYGQITTGYVFSAVINDDVPFDRIVDVRFDFIDTASDYSDFVYKRITVNPSYLDIAPNNIRTTLTSYGKNGFNNLAPAQGLGFMYKNYQESLYYESGYILAVPGKVCDAVRGSKDFDVVDKTDSIPVEETLHHFVSKFDDSRADTNRLGVNIRQDVYGFDTPALYNSLLYKLTITNDTVITLDSLFFGIFTDWDIYDYAHNFSDYDAVRKLAYSYYEGAENIYAGVMFLGDVDVHCYSFDNIANAENQIVIADGYSKQEKFQSMVSNRYQAGGSAGYDVAQTVSAGPFTVLPGDTLEIWFAYIAANSLQGLQTEADSLMALFEQMTQYNGTVYYGDDIVVYPNPASGVVYVKGDFDEVYIYDGNGKMVAKSRRNEIDITNLPAGTYFVKVKGANAVNKIFKFVKR